MLFVHHFVHTRECDCGTQVGAEPSNESEDPNSALTLNQIKIFTPTYIVHMQTLFSEELL